MGYCVHPACLVYQSRCSTVTLGTCLRLKEDASGYSEENNFFFLVFVNNQKAECIDTLFQFHAEQPIT